MGRQAEAAARQLLADGRGQVRGHADGLDGRRRERRALLAPQFVLALALARRALVETEHGEPREHGALHKHRQALAHVGAHGKLLADAPRQLVDNLHHVRGLRVADPLAPRGRRSPAARLADAVAVAAVETLGWGRGRGRGAGRRRIVQVFAAKGDHVARQARHHLADARVGARKHEVVKVGLRNLPPVGLAHELVEVRVKVFALQHIEDLFDLHVLQRLGRRRQ